MSNVDYQVRGNIGAYGDLVVGGVEDLAVVGSIEGHVQRGHGFRTERATLEATVLDPVARIVRVSYGDATGWLATATPGTWYLEIEMTWPGFSYTWPEPPQNPPRIYVRSDYDA